MDIAIIGSGRMGRAPAKRLLDDGHEGALDVGERPQTAAITKLLHNHMLLGELAVIAETIRVGSAACVENAFLSTTFRESPMLLAGLHNHIDVF